MPLVKIDMIKGVRSPEEIKKLADVVQEIMLAKFAAPPRDRYQVSESASPSFPCSMNHSFDYLLGSINHLSGFSPLLFSCHRFSCPFSYQTPFASSILLLSGLSPLSHQTNAQKGHNSTRALRTDFRRHWSGHSTHRQVDLDPDLPAR